MLRRKRRVPNSFHRRLRVERLEDRRLLAAGDLDPTFDGDGIVTTAIGTSSNAQDVAIQADGKIVVVGGSGSDFAVARYNADGALDTSFSGDGRLTTDFGAGDRAEGVAIQADGKIVVAGRNSGLFAVARYNADGSLDTSFSGDGKVTTNVLQGILFGRERVAIQADGKIVVVGSAFVSGGGGQYFVVLRYNANGSLDTSFSGDGIMTHHFPGSNFDLVWGMAIQADGKIVVAGHCGTGSNDFAVARYNANGSLDTAFSGDGMVSTAIGTSQDLAYDLAIQADGKIVVAGRSYDGSNQYIAVVRYNTDGSLDTSFSGDGKLTTAIGTNDFGHSVAIQADGKIVVAGGSHDGSNTHVAVVRYNADGSLDTSFSGDGKLTTSVVAEGDVAYDVAIQADGKIVVAGYTFSVQEIALVRYEWNNSPTNPAGVALSSINEDVADGSNTGTLVSAIVTASGSTDLDGNSLGIAVTTADSANGQWQYSTNGGGSWQSLSGVSTATARLLAPTHRVRFVPNANFNSTIGPSPTITFKVWDQTSGTAGSTGDTTVGSSYSASSATATQPVSAVNDEQVLATNVEQIVGQGAGAVITASVLATTDVDDGPGDLVYTVSGPPSHGTILVSGTPASTFTQQQINSGLVSYQHDGTANFADSFAFSVDDGEGATSAGTFSVAVAYPGDYNRDETVDAADYVFWRKMLGTSGVVAYSGADGDGDTAIDPDDEGVWTTNFGETAGGGGGGSASSDVSQETNAAVDPFRFGFQTEGRKVFRIENRESERLQVLTMTARHDALVAWLATLPVGQVQSDNSEQDASESLDAETEVSDGTLDAVFALL